MSGELKINPKEGHINLFRLGLAVAAFYWLLESLLHALVFGSHSLSESLFGLHNPNEFWMRLVIVTLLVGFGYLAERMMQRERTSRLREVKLNRLLQFLSDVNQKVQRHPEQQVLLDAACQSAVDIGKFRFAWIGMKQDDGLKLAAWAAADQAIGEEIRKLQEPGALLACLGCQNVLREGVSELCELETRNDCPAPFLEKGCRYAVVLPLQVKGQTVGVFEVYAGEEGEIFPDEKAILDEVADDVSVALTNIALAIEREQRSEELALHVEELERFQKATVQREFRIKELLDEIEELKKEQQS